MTVSNTIKIVVIDTQADPEPVRLLLRSFVRWHFDRHVEDKDLISEYFDEASFEKELSALPGKYCAPDGVLLLAYYHDESAGCVALRRIDQYSCEMKRMFVYDKFRGCGVGKQLAMEVVKHGRALGFKTMKLDTSFRQIEAQRLYRSIGFKSCEPYYELPDRLKNWLVFMEMSL